MCPCLPWHQEPQFGDSGELGGEHGSARELCLAGIVTQRVKPRRPLMGERC